MLLLIVCRVSRVLWSRRRKIFTVKKQIKNILAPHLEQNISLPFSFPFPVKYCEIIQAGVSKLILKRLHTPLRYQKLIMSVILILFYFSIHHSSIEIVLLTDCNILHIFIVTGHYFEIFIFLVYFFVRGHYLFEIMSRTLFIWKKVLELIYMEKSPGT